MKQLRIISAPALVLALVLTFAITPVLAEHGHSSADTTGDDTSVSSDDTTTSDDTPSSETELHHQGALLVAEMHRHHHSDQEIEHACEAHKQGLETKFSHVTTNAQRIEDRISGVLDKAVKYQQDNNLTATNFDTLVADANTAKANADTAIANLKAVTPSLDCNNVSVATDVATFKAAAKETRDSLKAYRTAVKNVIKALLDAKQGTDATGSPHSEGSQQ